MEAVWLAHYPINGVWLPKSSSSDPVAHIDCQLGGSRCSCGYLIGEIESPDFHVAMIADGDLKLIQIEELNVHPPHVFQCTHQLFFLVWLAGDLDSCLYSLSDACRDDTVVFLRIQIEKMESYLIESCLGELSRVFGFEWDARIHVHVKRRPEFLSESTDSFQCVFPVHQRVAAGDPSPRRVHRPGLLDYLVE